MAFDLLVCKWQRLRENDSYRIEEDEDLVEGVEQVRLAQDSPQDLTIDPLDASHYRRLYESSDLSFDADTYNNSEWIRDAIVELLDANQYCVHVAKSPTRARREGTPLIEASQLSFFLKYEAFAFTSYHVNVCLVMQLKDPIHVDLATLL
ncbi:hypothetical protein GQ600_2931 [Phytophthora cactorum]|nr:hypothetical protein GQ600_2931 [Phytophthora cactorum]